MTTATQPSPRHLPTAPVLSARALSTLARRARPAVTGAAFGGVVGVLLAGGGMDPTAAVAASTGFGLAAGLLVPGRSAADAADRDPGEQR